MNIEHLKEGMLVKCIKNTCTEFKEGEWYELQRDVVRDRLHIRGWSIIGSNTDLKHFDLANPRTPIDTEKMLENYKEMYNLLEEIEQNCTGFKDYPLATKIKSVLTKSKLPQ